MKSENRKKLEYISQSITVNQMQSCIGCIGPRRNIGIEENLPESSTASDQPATEWGEGVYAATVNPHHEVDRDGAAPVEWNPGPAEILGTSGRDQLARRWGPGGGALVP